MKTVKRCPKCGSGELSLYVGGETGVRYQCGGCGYIGPLIIEEDTNPEIEEVVRILIDNFGEKWHSREPFRVLITTILSQRTKDENTEKAAEELFRVYKTPESISKAPIKYLERLIRSSGFYRVKARNIKKVSSIIAEKYGGKVPDDMDELLKLPGVGRKTAGVVMVAAFKKPVCIPTDVHLHKISNRLGWVQTKTPEQTEQELMRIVPKKYWLDLNLTLVRFGQKICLSRKPRCNDCPIARFCRYYRNLKSAGK